jgi:ABC-type polysaccharide/polyol phosphate transport system ATPase subunit
MGYQTFIGIQESENMKKIFKSTFKYSKLKKLQYPVELYSSGLYLNVKKVEAR